MRAPPVLWAAAGYPSPRRETSPAVGRCYWCAAVIDGQACPVADVISDSFTDQDQALERSSAWLCCACAWAMTGRPPDTLRLWSIAYAEDGRTWPANHPSAPNLGASIHLQNKADPSAFRSLLRSPPAGRWICSIADSGQIHTLPFAPVNDSATRYGVRYERSTAWTSAAEYCRLDDLVAEAMAAGFAKQDLTDAEIADRVGCSRARVGQIRAEQGIAGRGAGRPRGEAITHRSQAGRLLLATLVDQAAQLGVTPGEIVAAGVEAVRRR